MQKLQPLNAAESRKQLEELRAALLRPQQTAQAEIFAARGGEARRRLLRVWLRRSGLEVLPLRPPEPWDPLAPLRHLLAHHGQHFPETDTEELCLPSLWLGTDTSWSRILLRASLSLAHRPTLAGIRRSDFDAPVWGAMLSFVRQGKLHLPVSFLFEADRSERLLPGVVRLDLDELDETVLEEASGPEPPDAPTRPGKRALAYLAQARFFGDELRPAELRTLTRVDQERRLAELEQSGLLGSDRRLRPERLDGLALPAPPRSRRWNERALAVLKRRGEGESSRALWLRARLGEKGPRATVAAAQACRAAIELGDREARALLRSLPERSLQQEASAVSVLLAIDLGEPFRPAEGEALQLGIVRLGMPFGPLLLGRLAMRKGERDAGRQIAACQERLAAGGHVQEAGLLGLELARWHLAHFRIRPGLKAIGSVSRSEHWVVQWLRNLAMAESYIRMERLDFARSHIQKAVTLPPRPMSPVLKADLYVTMGHMFSRAGFGVQAESILDRARDSYIGARDGVRLGRYLIVRGEMYWRARDEEKAKQSFARALRIFTELRAGLMTREAELKMALILHGVKASTLELESESRPQDLDLRQRFPEGIPPKTREALDAE